MMFSRLPFLIFVFVLIISPSSSQTVEVKHKEIAAKLLEAGLHNCEAFALLKELCEKAPHRLSGSIGADTAVHLTKQMMMKRGFSNVHLEKVMVPHWERGEEECWIVPSVSKTPQVMRIQKFEVCALGGSVATPAEGVQAEVVEVKSLEEAKKLGERASGKIIFYNRAFDATKLNTFEAYGGAVDQRSRGAIVGGQVGAVAVLVRSMTGKIDDKPHTGMMNYADSVKKIPAAAISTIHANQLSELLAKQKKLKLHLKLTPKSLPDKESANVVGEIVGTEKPNEIIVVAGHLDAWDKGHGAHDDGAGCMQAIEAVNLLKNIGVQPKRTIRAVMFMNEENGARGGKAYPVAPERKGEKHIAAFESDAGGHAPRGFSGRDSAAVQKALRWKSIFEMFNADKIVQGYSGVDISFLEEAEKIPGFGMVPENHRYFDYHHSDNDTIDKVHPRELEMGAIVMAMWAYLVSEEF